MQLIAPHRICRLLGHRRQGYNAGEYTDRRGRWRTRWYQRCTRCGTTSGDEVYREGILEGWRYWRPRVVWWRCRDRIKAWWRTDCDDCRKPEIRFGRRVGNHDNCDPIPF